MYSFQKKKRRFTKHARQDLWRNVIPQEEESMGVPDVKTNDDDDKHSN